MSDETDPATLAYPVEPAAASLATVRPAVQAAIRVDMITPFERSPVPVSAIAEWPVSISLDTAQRAKLSPARVGLRLPSVSQIQTRDAVFAKLSQAASDDHWRGLATARV